MKRTAPATALAGLVLTTGLALLAPATPASAGVPVSITGRASVLPGAAEPASKGDSTDAIVSGNGRYVIFSSTARLVAADTDTVKDVYRKDLLTDSVVRVNVTVDGSAASATATAAAITPDGRSVAFFSGASNLVPSDTNAKTDVFVRDLVAGTTDRVSVSTTEQAGTGNSPNDQDGTVDITPDGRYVVFSSTAPNFGADADTVSDIFRRDRIAGTTELMSVSDAEVSSDADSYHPSMSDDARFVAFQSTATNLVAGDTNGTVDAFVRDRLNGTTQRVSVHDSEAQSGAGGWDPWIDGSGNKVVFTSSSKLNAIDPNNTNDVFIRDRSGSTTTVGSVGTDGWAAGSSQDPTISGDGSTVAFQSTSAKALAGGNAWEHIYTRKITTTTRHSVTTGGQVVTGASSHPSLSDNAQVVAFDSNSSGLVIGDTGQKDVFFRRRITFGPFHDTLGFIQRQTADFLGNSQSGTTGPIDTRIRNGASPEHALIGLANTPSFAGKRPQLIRLYVAYFTRMPDAGGLNYWLNKLNNGTKLDAVSAQFAASNEFKTKYGNTTNTAFVNLVYTNVLDRAPDSAGLAYWVNKLNNGLSRGTVMTSFSESNEGKRHFSPWVQSALLSLGMIDKLPTGSLLTQMLDAGGNDSPEAAARVIIDSPEYAAVID